MDTINTGIKDDYTALAQGTAPEELAKHRQNVCCVERYDVDLIRNVPKAVVEADLGCGNPTRYLRAGDTVLDIGCGAGMNCYVAAQIAGPTGRVIGVDFNDAMLAIARGAQAGFAETVAAAPMTFVKASANDLALDLEWADGVLAEVPVRTTEEFLRHHRRVDEVRRTRPAISDASADVVISNCVINLLDDVDKPAVFQEIFRVLKPGGRFAISDNVSNIPVPETVKKDRILWSACYAGVLQEQEFYTRLEAAGFVNLRIEVRNPDPALEVEDLVFYSITVTGEKAGADVASPDVMYRGPLKAIVGESGKIYRRGVIETLASKDRHMAADPEAYGFLLSQSGHAQETASCCAPAPTSCCG